MSRTVLFIIEKVFKHNDIQVLENEGTLNVFQKCTEAMFENYCIHYDFTDDESIYIEFACARIVYLAMHLDEYSSHKYLFELPLDSIHKMIPKTWYTSRLLEYERNALKMCNYNPIRYCLTYLNDDTLEVQSPLYKISCESQSLKI